MCGICGIAFNDFNALADETRIKTMMRMIVHRGPDEEGLVISPGAAMGFRRLSIIDLATGNQPISNEDKSVFTVCNGEIYNYRELTARLKGLGHRFRSTSDAEVIVHLYEEYGSDFVKHLRGMFAIALWDTKRRELLLIRDRLGIKPLHYAVSSEGILFASEQKAILADSSVRRDMDTTALRDIFSFGFVPGNQTLFKDIRRIPPASLMRFKQGEFNIETYWKLDLNRESGKAEKKLSERDWAGLVREKLTESVESHLVSDVPVAAWLSPGIDSSAIVATMRRLGRMPAETFTMQCEDPAADETAENPVLNRYQGFRDIPNRLITLKKTDFNLMPEVVWHGEDPFTSATEIASTVLSRETGKDYKVVLTGEGSDEVFGGYTWYRIQKLLKPFLYLPVSFRRILTSFQGLRDRRPGATGFLSVSDPGIDLDHFSSMTGCSSYYQAGNAFFTPEIMRKIENSEQNHLLRHHIIPGNSGFRRIQASDFAYRLSNVITHHLDRSSMAYGLEARVPFLDHLFVEQCTLIPDKLKLKMFCEKYILRQAMKDDLPAAIVRRRKRPMSAPFADWLRGPLPEFAIVDLSEKSLKATGYFEAACVRGFLKEHQSGRMNHGRILTGILGVQVWDRLLRKMKVS
ncbi:MAG: asparagine synthase (glutamine-hydrolyzing) [Acidobacteriota bacterium]